MKNLFLSAFIATTTALPAFALQVEFTNPGFENGNYTGWTLHSGDWDTNSQTINDSHQGDSAVISNPSATDSKTLGNLRQVLSGNDSFRLNNAANGAHFSTLTQTVSNYAGQDLYFGFAAVLENPSNPHTEDETPKFSFTLTDNTSGLTLYSASFNSRNAVSQGITWNTGLDVPGNTSTWMYSDWNIVHLDTTGSVGNSLTLTVRAYDCALGGHGGYAYIDAFLPVPPTPNAGVVVNYLNVDSSGNATQTPPPVAAVPETSTWVMGFLALGAVVFMFRRAKA